MSIFERIIPRGLLGSEPMMGNGDDKKEKCPERCTCGGSTPGGCTIPIGDDHSAHCEKKMCASACRGKCDDDKGHKGAHSCGHGHTFPR